MKVRNLLLVAFVAALVGACGKDDKKTEAAKPVDAAAAAVTPEVAPTPEAPAQPEEAPATETPVDEKATETPATEKPAEEKPTEATTTPEEAK